MFKIALTMGDPAGIGAEIILKALKESDFQDNAFFYVFGDASVFYETSRLLNIPYDIPVVSIEQFKEHIPWQSCIVDFSNVHGRIQWGVEKGDYGRCAVQYIEEAAYFCMSNRLDAMITAPINKRSVHLAGYEFPGHTEFLAELTNTSDFAMSFYADNLWTVLLTTHMPIGQAIREVKKDNLLKLIHLSYRELSKYIEKPVVAVASLNPHGAEGGLFGMEEGMEILPAISECQKEGLQVYGPFSADTVFLKAMKGDYNIVIAHYHDQCTIPVKLMSFGNAVNVTLGLPFLRTSVDHGTAFDIAGQGRASAENMIETMKLTISLLEKKIESQDNEG